MALLLVVGAAYAAYASKKESEKAKIDPLIKVRGKTVVDLHPVERELGILELPIATISFFEGDYTRADKHLRSRCEEILKANAWLAGWLLPMPDLKIVYDKTGKDRPPGQYELFEPGIVPLKHTTPYALYSEMLKDAVVPSNLELVGQNRPLFKVSLVPDAGEPFTRFALIVSMSHTAGDSHTYYKIYNMLNEVVKVETLDPVRVEGYHEALSKNIGKPEMQFLSNILSENKPQDDSDICHEVIENLDAVVNDSLQHSGRDKEQPLLRSFRAHQLAQPKAPKIVMKLFYINEDWVIRRRGRRASIFEGDEEVDGMAATTLSANSIISSWFFTINKCSIGMLMLSLRHRLRDCPISDTDAGNYIHSLLCTKEDYCTPQSVQYATHTLHRDSVQSIEFDSRESSSLCVNWANSYHDGLILDKDCRQTLHMPIYNTSLLKFLPHQVSAINIFTARCASTGVERRAGAFVVCKESV